MTYYLLDVEVTSWGPLILTDVVPLWVLLCEVAVFCYKEFRSGGYLRLSNCYTVIVTRLWEVSRLFTVVLGLAVV